MTQKFNSLLEELSNSVPLRNKELFIESQADHLISSVINLFELINETFDDENADELKRRFQNSIKSGDSKKFTRKIRQLRNSNSKEMHEKTNQSE